MKKQIIKDQHTYLQKSGNVEKEMPGRGDGEAKKLMQLAKDQKDILFDVEIEIIDITRELQQRKSWSKF